MSIHFFDTLPHYRLSIGHADSRDRDRLTKLAAFQKRALEHALSCKCMPTQKFIRMLLLHYSSPYMWRLVGSNKL